MSARGPLEIEARVASLVARIDAAWRGVDGATAAFADVARASLLAAPIFDGATGEDVLAALVASRGAAAPNQGRRADSVMLFEGPRFSIRVRLAVDELGCMRSTGAAGALQILAGPVACARARFAPSVELDTQFALGALTRDDFEVLDAGAAVAFAPDAIHALTPLRRAGAWLVIETNESLGACALDFVAPGARLGLEVDHATDHRFKCFGVLYQLDPARCGALLATALGDEDPRTCFLLLRHAATAFPAVELARLCDAAASRFGTHATCALGAVARHARSHALQRLLARGLAPAARLLIAALDQAADGRDLDALLATGPLGTEATALALAARGDAASPFASIARALDAPRSA